MALPNTPAEPRLPGIDSSLPIREQAINEVLAALPSEAHRLLLRLALFAAPVPNPRTVTVGIDWAEGCSPKEIAADLDNLAKMAVNVENQRLRQHLDADAYRRKALGELVLAPQGAEWDALMPRLKGALSIVAEIEDATGVRCEDDPTLWINEIAALCRKGRASDSLPQDKTKKLEEPTAPEPLKVIAAEVTVTPSPNTLPPNQRPWKLACTPNEAQLAARLWAEGKSNIEVAANAGIGRDTAEAVRSMAADFIARLKLTAKDEWDGMLATRLGVWQKRYDATKAQGQAA